MESFVGTEVSVDLKNLLNNHFKPGADYLPHKWALAPTETLACVCRQENSEFCLPCVLLVNTVGPIHGCPLTTLSKELELLCKHTNKDHHKTAFIRSEEFIATIIIQGHLNQAMASRVFLNYQKLQSIFEVVNI